MSKIRTNSLTIAQFISCQNVRILLYLKLWKTSSSLAMSCSSSSMVSAYLDVSWSPVPASSCWVRSRPVSREM